MPFSLLLFAAGAAAGVSLKLGMMALPCFVVGQDVDMDDDTDVTYVDSDSDGWYTDDSNDDYSDDGLTEEEVRRLPWFAYSSDGGGGGGDGCCNICLEEMRDGEKCRRLGRCGHAFHAACVDEWLTTRRTCPCCREQVSVPSDSGCSLLTRSDRC